MGGMKFRDLKCFNQALLAKQGWRLSRDILHLVLKGHYFKHSKFLEALRDFNPSYNWRSIWGAKSLLMEGLKWRVGNDTSIKVCEDAWLLGEGAHFVPIPFPNINLDLRVCDLLDVENGGWKVDVVNETFSVEERQINLDIPPPSTWRCDSQYWWPTSDGNYMVHSGYWLGEWVMCEHENCSLDKERERFLWKIVWKIVEPPPPPQFVSLYLESVQGELGCDGCAP